MFEMRKKRCQSSQKRIKNVREIIHGFKFGFYLISVVVIFIIEWQPDNQILASKDKGRVRK